MKKLTYLFAAFFLMFTLLASGKNLKAVFAYKTFYTAEKGPYIETYLSVAGSSVTFSKLDNGKFQGKIEVTLSFKINNEIKYFDKYNLLSPEVDDVDNVAFNFIDQQRMPLNNGKYLMEISIADKNAGAKPFSSKQEVTIEYYPNIVSVSDIELVESFKKSEATSMLTKNGFEIIPYVDNFYSQSMNSLKFYSEIYNVQKVAGDGDFLITYYIQTFENKRMIEKYRAFTKQESKNVNVLMSEFPIQELPSGNFNLVVEVRNKKNDLLAYKDVLFQRSNDNPAGNVVSGSGVDFAFQYTDKDSLIEFIRSLRPISNSNEANIQNNQAKIGDVKSMQNYLNNFWATQKPDNPEQGWLAYYEMVKKVNFEYKVQNKKGYETDRGRVYLQYNPPNEIIKEYHEAANYPYEIWHYFSIGSQTNKKFIFYNPDLVTNDFALLHSDALGEPYDGQWQIHLRKRDVQVHDLDNDLNLDGFGNNANKNYGSNPR